MDVIVNKLYNEKIKEMYLATFPNSDTATTIRYKFYKTELYEAKRDKDIYDFNLTDLAKAIKGTNPYSLSVAQSTGRFIYSYISWAIDKGLRKNNIHPMDGVNQAWYEELIDRSKKIHYSYDEFIELVNELPNAQDKALLMLLWHGILGHSFSELRQLNMNDINWTSKEIYIEERNQYVKVCDKCLEFIKEAYHQPVFYTYVSKENKYNERELISSGYIFKNTKSPRINEEDPPPVSQAVLYTRIRQIKEALNLEYLTPNGVRQSGMISMVVDLVKEKVKNGGESEITYHDIIKPMGDKYNFAKASKGDYYNQQLLKDFLTEENIRELYEMDVEV
jgi:integrase